MRLYLNATLFAVTYLSPEPQFYPLSQSGNYMYRLYVHYNLCISVTDFICAFHMILRVNKDYFPKQPQPVGLCNRDAECFLLGRNFILKCY
jgi:hypothetical protein